jgi:RES domain-containing protein
VRYDVPDDLAVETFALIDLPADWRQQEGWTQQRGDRWHESMSTPLLRVPSAVVPLDQSPDMNILINHNHNAAPRISPVSVEPFVLDPRLF